MNPPKSLKTNRSPGFTLVELLVVITIIVVLATLTVGAMGYVQKKAAVDKTRTQIALLENGLEQFYADNGYYPEGDNSLVVYQALFGDGINPDGTFGTPDGIPDEGATVYIQDLDPATDSRGMIKKSGNQPTGLVDPFGGDYLYMSGPAFKAQMNNPDFDLSSKGPDGRDQSDKDRADDIVNW